MKDSDYICGSCDTSLSTLHNTMCCVVLITECHNSQKHSQSPLTNIGPVSSMLFTYIFMSLPILDIYFTVLDGQCSRTGKCKISNNITLAAVVFFCCLCRNKLQMLLWWLYVINDWIAQLLTNCFTTGSTRQTFKWLLHCCWKEWIQSMMNGKT